MTIPPSIRDQARDVLLLSILEGHRRESPRGHRFTVVEPDGTELTAEDLEARIAEREREGGDR
jgi:hypothetical protein